MWHTSTMPTTPPKGKLARVVDAKAERGSDCQPQAIGPEATRGGGSMTMKEWDRSRQGGAAH